VELHHPRMVGLDLQPQTRRSMERRIIPRSRGSRDPFSQVKAIGKARKYRERARRAVYSVAAGASGISVGVFDFRVFIFITFTRLSIAVKVLLSRPAVISTFQVRASKARTANTSRKLCQARHRFFE